MSLVPSGSHGSFTEWFAYSALRLGYPIGYGLIAFGFHGSSAARFTALRIFYLLFIYVCMLGTNICLGTYLASGLYSAFRLYFSL